MFLDMLAEAPTTAIQIIKYVISRDNGCTLEKVVIRQVFLKSYLGIFQALNT